MTVTDERPGSTATSATHVTGVLVVGAGQMGSGIAQVAATNGFRTWLIDTDAAGLDRARTTIARSVERLRAKDAISDEQAVAAEEIVYAGAVGDVPSGDVQVAIEAVVESPSVKRAVFTELDQHLPAGAILASNTSSIPITELGAATTRPAQVVGMHFMNPVPMLDLVEVIPGMETAAETLETVEALARALGKTPVRSADAPGFITNRILMPMINEAFFCLHEGVGTAEAIDESMRLGMKHPLGPLALADLIGLDTCLAIMEVLHTGLGEDKYRPCPLLRRYVQAGRLGRKSGAGIYEYGG